MPSVFTHAVAGSAISTLAPRGFRGLKLAVVLAFTAAVPDVDVLAFRFGIPYSHPFGHRGISHSLPFALLVAFVSWIWISRGVPRLSRSCIGLFLVVFLACASHGFLDAFTDAGLGVGFFIPFNETRYFFPWRPLLTSPLRIGRFFSDEGAAILRNEIIWVWLPIGLGVLTVTLIRHTMGMSNKPLQPTRRTAPRG